MLPVVTMIGMDIGTALGGVIFIETVFGLPGPRRDVARCDPAEGPARDPGVVTFTTIGILLLNLVVDIAYAFIDPRVRQAQERRGRARASAGGRSAPVAEPAASTS